MVPCVCVTFQCCLFLKHKSSFVHTMAHVNEVTQADDTRNIHEQKSNPMPIKQREQYRMRKVSSSAPPELANTSTPGSRSPSVPAEAFEYPASETSDTGAVHYSDRYFWDGSEENGNFLFLFIILVIQCYKL